MTKLDDPIRHAIIGEGDPSIVRNNDTSSSLQIYPNDEQINLEESSTRNLSGKHLTVQEEIIHSNSTMTADSSKKNLPQNVENSIPSDLTRLPRCVIPKRYELKLNVGNPEDLEYSGQVNIRIYFNNPVDTIWLHSKRLEITEAFLQSSLLADQYDTFVKSIYKVIN